ncbi:MAG: hypothetical protein C0483_06865 [Pirellula sp.]|nr:hypothetical protein [Pirellula sp.]
MAGGVATSPPTFAARLSEPFMQRGDRPTYWPGRCDVAEAGATGREVTPLRWQGSGDLRTLVDADCLICFPSGNCQYAAGDDVTVRRLH